MNRSVLYHVLVHVLVVLVTGQLAACTASSPDPEPERFQLKVSLYPYIPEVEAFFSWIESDFEAKNPDIDLVVRALEKSYEGEAGYVADLAYETDKAMLALTDAAGDDFQHLVEIDALTLGTLAQNNAIAPFRVEGLEFLAAADEAVTWSGQHFGVPHWTCGNFIITEDPAIRDVRNVDELVAALERASAGRIPLAGDMDGSWGAISTYLDVFMDTYPQLDKQAALAQPLDATIMGHLQKLRSVCIKDDVNHCAEDAVELLATGEAAALFGFSERLNPVLQHPDRKVGELHVSTATIGGGNTPAAFVDALVKSRTCTTEPCSSAAQRFADYYVSDATFETSLMTTPSGVPRYLLPSTTSAFDVGRVGQDRLYQELQEEATGAAALPNSGVPEARTAGTIRPQVQAALGLDP
jgi:thiamine pyridinylase